MKTVSMLEFRVSTEQVIKLLRRNERVRLTYRGKPLADLVPVSNAPTAPSADDPFYHMHEIASKAGSLENAEIDSIVYGEQ